ncbi:MAG: hypothetical protein MIL41_01260 [Hyphomicrobiales bacterium]
MAWVLQIHRIRQERRAGQSFARTISKYQVFHDEAKVDDLLGFFVERQGPGDNSKTGVKEHRRIAAGTYPISTHDGAGNEKYKTIGYAGDSGIGSIPRPCIRLDETDRRSGILIHPGNGYLWSIGCFNPASTMTDASSNIRFSDSRSRVIAIIDDLKTYLGSSFPRANNRTVPNASIVIKGEP